MPSRIPLYARILGWFFLNVAVLLTLTWLILRPDHPPEWFVKQQAEPRLQPVARLLVQELMELHPDEWTDILTKYDESHGMTFAVFGAGGRQIAGVSLDPPEKVRRHLNPRPQGLPEGLPGGVGGQPGSVAGGGGFAPARRQEGARQFNPGNPLQPEPGFPGDQPRPGAGGGLRFPQDPSRQIPNPNPRGLNPPVPGGPGGRPARLNMSFDMIPEHTDDPSAWWFIMRMPLRQGGSTLVLRTENLDTGWLLGDLKPWLWGAAGVLVLSALLWFPFVRGITRSVGRMKSATANIAAGGFDVSIPDKRRDELGELAAGINRMAARLSGFVTGQKRFLGDIAHELCTPLARMQMAGAALEQRAPEELRPRVADLIAEAEAMSQLVSELLDFSRAGLAPQSVALTDVLLRPLVEQVASREAVPPERLTLQVPPDLSARASPGLLSRAVGNVIRNSLRYAGPQARLEIAAHREHDHVVLTIADDGPGVPAGSLPNLFDPFFRLESARDRASGGTGLGLAIVRTCVESCGGSVTAGNRRGGGLEIRFHLPLPASGQV